MITVALVHEHDPFFSGLQEILKSSPIETVTLLLLNVRCYISGNLQ